jgi:ketosteroid isomerase-like protein
MPSHSKISELIRESYRAYVEKDRSIIEPLLADDFVFTSPADDHIDRATYFVRCWPNAERVVGFEIEQLVESGNHAFVLYRMTPKDGKPFRNTEVFTIEGDKIKEVMVFFGPEEKS